MRLGSAYVLLGKLDPLRDFGEHVLTREVTSTTFEVCALEVVLSVMFSSIQRDFSQNRMSQLESLILAQNERWRQA
jgi:hypothetical protein